jgi:hypothetical protein
MPWCCCTGLGPRCARRSSPISRERRSSERIFHERAVPGLRGAGHGLPGRRAPLGRGRALTSTCAGAPGVARIWLRWSSSSIRSGSSGGAKQWTASRNLDLLTSSEPRAFTIEGRASGVFPWVSATHSRRPVTTSATSGSRSSTRPRTFLPRGLERDELCVLLGHDAANARVVVGLERRGFQSYDIRRRHRFHTVSGQQPAGALLQDIDARIRTAIGDGIPMVRVLGHLGWGHPGWPGEQDILSLEARVTHVVRNLPSVFLCAYDVRALSGRQLLLGGLESHPLTLRRGALRHNEHCVAAATLLA